MTRHSRVSRNVITFISTLRESPMTIWRQAFMRVMRTGSFLKVLPFTWDAQNQKLAPCPISQNVAWHILLVSYCLDLLYLAYMSQQVSLATYSNSKYINFFAHFFTRATAGAMAVSLAFQKDALLKFSCALIQMQKRLRGKF